MEVLNKYEAELNSLFTSRYEAKEINGEMYYTPKIGEAFHIENLHPFRNALVIEYANGEDGGLYYPEDYINPTEMYNAMLQEIAV